MPIIGGIATSTDGLHTHTYTDKYLNTDDDDVKSGHNLDIEETYMTENKVTGSDGSHSHTVKIPAHNTNSSGITESRPVNRAVTYIIRAL